MLRFFCPSTVSPDSISGCVLRGMEHTESKLHLLVENGNIVKRNESLKRPPLMWALSNTAITDVLYRPLTCIHLLLLYKPKTDIQKTLIDSLQIYTKSSLVSDPTDKLIYIFTALETLLLKDRNEPVLHALRDRFAFLLRDTPASRIEMVALFNNVYNFRSKYLHHGYKLSELDNLKLFMVNVHTLYLRLILNWKTLGTKDSFFKYLEKLKYS